MSDSDVTEIRATIDALIQAGTTADLSGLDTIYHDDMKIEMIDTEGTLTQADKPSFIAMLKEMVSVSGRAANTWARYNIVEAQGERGHVLITRKVSLGGNNRILELSIDLMRENARWQVIREVIFARPDPDAAAS